MLYGSSTGVLKDYVYDNGEDVFSTVKASTEEGGTEKDSLAQGLRNAGVIVPDIDESGAEVLVWPTNLMGKARIELQLEPTADLSEDDILMRKFGFTVIYLALVMYTMLFLFRYLKRLLMLVFLTIIAPLVAMTYPLDKIKDGSAQAFNMWFKEYMFNLLIQPVHLILYTILIGSAIDLVADNLLFALVALGFILQAEKLLRKFFGFDKASTIAGGSALGGALAMQGVNQLRKLGSGHGKSGSKDGGKNSNSDGNKKIRNADKGKDANSLIDDIYGSGNDSNSGSNPPQLPDGPNQGEPDAQRRMLDADEENGIDPTEREARERELNQSNNNSNSSDSPEDIRQKFRDLGYSEEDIDDVLGKETEQSGDNSANGTSGGDSTTPYQRTRREFSGEAQTGPKRNLKSVAKGAWAVAGAGFKYAAPKAARLGLRTLGAGAAATAGIAAGLVSEDYSNAIKWGVAGAGAGWAAGGGIGRIGSKVAGLGEKAENAINNAGSIYTTEAYGKKAEEKRQNDAADALALKDKDRQKYFAEKLNISSKKEIKQVMKEAQEYRKYGVTDDGIIAEAMKAEDFGKGRDSKDRILAATMATEVGKDKKELKLYEEDLKKKNLKEEDIKKYSNFTREHNNWVKI